MICSMDMGRGRVFVIGVGDGGNDDMWCIGRGQGEGQGAVFLDTWPTKYSYLKGLLYLLRRLSRVFLQSR